MHRVRGRAHRQLRHPGSGPGKRTHPADVGLPLATLGFWETSLNGAYNAANTTSHFYFDGVIAKCDSPRLATIPIVSENLNWDLGDPNPAGPTGRRTSRWSAATG